VQACAFSRELRASLPHLPVPRHRKYALSCPGRNKLPLSRARVPTATKPARHGRLRDCGHIHGLTALFRAQSRGASAALTFLSRPSFGLDCRIDVSCGQKIDTEPPIGVADDCHGRPLTVATKSGDVAVARNAAPVRRDPATHLELRPPHSRATAPHLSPFRPHVMVSGSFLPQVDPTWLKEFLTSLMSLVVMA
jgi:hypothetical protein